MASQITIDPVQGLVDYVLEIKPYHTKIVEVLVEYVQSEPIDVTIAESFDLCINLGIPDIDTRYSYPIIGVDTITNTFTVSGDKRLALHIGQVMEVFSSSLNNNRYTITSLVYDGTNTKVGVQTNIPSTVIDGVIVYRIIEYCPDSNLYGEFLAPENIEESCSIGFGQVFDSISSAYNITSFNTTTNQIIVAGNLSSTFAMDIQFHLEYVTDAAPQILVDAVYTVDTVTVDNSDPLNPITTITTLQSIPTLDFGSPLMTPSVTAQSIYPLDTQYTITATNDGGVNIFSISGDLTSIFTAGSLIDVSGSDGNDGIYYVLRSDYTGGDTKISVAQHIAFPSATRQGRLKFKTVGFDEVIQCTNAPEARIDIRFDERLEFTNTQIDLRDDIIAYNFENTDNTPFGGLPYGTIIDSSAPTITSQTTAPLPTGSPAVIPLFSLWYDVYDDATNKDVKVPSGLKQWNGLRWVSISTANWFDSTNDKLYQRRFAYVGGSPSIIDTGWLEVTTIGGFDNFNIAGVGNIQPIAIQNYTVADIGGGVPQTSYTLATAVAGADPELFSVTVNGLPAAFTLTSSTTFTLEFLEGSPAVDIQNIVNPGDWVIATVKDRNGTQSNVLIAGFANEPHAVFHGGTYGGGSPLANIVTSSVSPDKFEIYGGNFAYHFFGNTKFEGYNDIESLGQWQATSYTVTAVSSGGSPVSNTMSIVGDKTTYFTTGLSFYVNNTLTNKGWFTIKSSSFDGTNTIIVVNETVTTGIFTNDHYGVGSPATIDSQTTINQNYSRDLGVIQGALFDASTQKTIVIPRTTGNVNVTGITYKWIGPVHIDIDFIPSDLMASTIPDVLGVSNQIISSANYLNIVAVDTTLDTFTVIGNQTTLFPDDSEFTIQDSGTDGSPLVTNDGAWSVDRSFYNGAGYEDIIAIDISGSPGGDTFTIVGNYADKFVPGFPFTVYGYRTQILDLSANNLWVYGDNRWGQLGTGEVGWDKSKSSPVQTITGGNWKYVSAGHFNTSSAIKSDGSLWLWGINYDGQLGDNSIIHKSSPIQTVAGGTDWAQVSMGGDHTAAIKTNGELWLWGTGSLGQLGDGTFIAKSSPVQTVAGGTDWLQVACGVTHTAAIKTDGTLWTWGVNNVGQLADNTTVNKNSPVQTVSGGTDWKQVSCGDSSIAAIKTDGTLWTWGWDKYGQLGTNLPDVDKSSPVQTISGGNDWKQVSHGVYHVVAIKTDSTLWGWGKDDYGQLGDESIVNKSSPVQTVSGGNDWAQADGGQRHTAAIKTDGTLWGCGYDGYGQLGADINWTVRIAVSSPIQIVAGGNDWTQVSCGYQHTLAIEMPYISVESSGNYTVLTPGAILSGNNTIIPVTTDLTNDTSDGVTLAFGGTDETLIYVVGDVVTNQQPYGRIVDLQGATSGQLSGQITDNLEFGWTVEDWFQYTILSADLVENTITVAGDARADLQIGQDFEILGAFDTTGSPPGGSPSGVTNNGLYKVRIDEDYRSFGSPIMSRTEVEYDGSTSTTITVYPELSTLVQPFGFIEPNNDAQAIITFTDQIGVVYTELVDATVIQTGGSIMDSWDYPFWDVGSFDETLGTVIHLYSNTFE